MAKDVKSDTTILKKEKNVRLKSTSDDCARTFVQQMGELARRP